jgi:hypothetical protein
MFFFFFQSWNLQNLGGQLSSDFLALEGHNLEGEI